MTRGAERGGTRRSAAPGAAAPGRASPPAAASRPLRLPQPLAELRRPHRRRSRPGGPEEPRGAAPSNRGPGRGPAVTLSGAEQGPGSAMWGRAGE